MSLTNDTFTNNSATTAGGGLDTDGSPALLYNTIVAGNYIAGASYSTMPSEIGGTVSGSYNLIGDPSSRGGLPNGADGNIVGIDGQVPFLLSTIFATDTNGVPLLAGYGGPAADRRPGPGQSRHRRGERSAAQLPGPRPARTCHASARPTSAPSRARGSP